MTTLSKMIIPPIVGVPVFFRCVFGPSSLTVCPAFNFLKKGMITGLKSTLTAKEMTTGATGIASVNLIFSYQAFPRRTYLSFS